MKSMRLPQHIVTDPSDSQPELMVGAFALVQQVAAQNQMNIGINGPAAMRDSLLGSLFIPDAANALAAGEALPMENGVVVSVVPDGALAEFEGIILYLGAEPARVGLVPSVKSPMVIVPQTEAELEALRAALPAAGYVQLRPEPPLTLSDSQSEGCNWFDERYDPLVRGHFNPNSTLVRLGEGEPQVCRYCGKGKPDVTFSSVSHAFPEQIGNKKLVDARECDACNAHFAKKVDDDFSKWSLPVRSSGRVRGKRSVPSYKSMDEKFRMDHINGSLQLKVQDGDPRLKFDEEAKQLSIEFERQPYTPMGVFKCFLKMMLAVMPEPQASECAALKDWILQPQHTERTPFKPLLLLSQFVPGPLPNDKVTYMLLRRKEGVADCAYMVFVVQFSNYLHQIAVPTTAPGKSAGTTDLTLRYFPHPWDTPEHEKEFGKTLRRSEDLTSHEVRRGETVPLAFHFDRIEQTFPRPSAVDETAGPPSGSDS